MQIMISYANRACTGLTAAMIEAGLGELYYHKTAVPSASSDLVRDFESAHLHPAASNSGERLTRQFQMSTFAFPVQHLTLTGSSEEGAQHPLRHTPCHSTLE